MRFFISAFLPLLQSCYFISNFLNFRPLISHCFPKSVDYTLSHNLRNHGLAIDAKEFHWTRKLNYLVVGHCCAPKLTKRKYGPIVCGAGSSLGKGWLWLDKQIDFDDETWLGGFLSSCFCKILEVVGGWKVGFWSGAWLSY